MNEEIYIRTATQDDSDILYNLLKEMRDGEGRLDAFVVTPEEFKRDGFGENRCFEACVVEHKDNKEVIGFATYFFGYNGDCGKILYLEDIFIKPVFRSKGYGTAVFKYMAKITLGRGARRMEWCVMNDPSWNAKTIEFYKKFNSIDDNLKQLYLHGDVLQKCAE
ncbi:thialysine N-epsilon-acetyltransferase-like [Ostrea edulis]|uniref:thialysine N-epsilon-acetyltransferase-like n=1 Tax=Ostrea edulis TaxID=37623 RepID=UPI0024AF330C|nr:thialysine N-epsilon-acetyltransferase-like [Ostrea edulis]